MRRRPRFAVRLGCGRLLGGFRSSGSKFQESNTIFMSAQTHAAEALSVAHAHSTCAHFVQSCSATLKSNDSLRSWN